MPLTARTRSARRFKIPFARVCAERQHRAAKMVEQGNTERFGNCTNIGECEAVCPKGIKIEVIALMNRDYLIGAWKSREKYTDYVPETQPLAGGRS